MATTKHGATILKSRISQLLLIFIITLTLTDISVRVVFDNPNYFYEGRYLFLSDGIIPINRDGFWNFSSNKAFRETAVYRTGMNDYFIEYDCAYKSDDLGFVDNKPHIRDYDYLLIGDSFTFGQGGCPWIDKLRERNKNTTIYNAGLMGTGINHWKSTLAFLKQNFAFKKLIVIYISNDFFRDGWLWPKEQLDCLQTGKCEKDYWYPETEDTKVLALARARASDRENILSRAVYFANRYLWPEMLLVSQIKRFGKYIIHYFDHRTADELIPKNSRESFDEIVRTNRDMVTFVQIPAKSEAAMHTDNNESLSVSAFMKKSGIQNYTCKLNYSDYLNYDDHPNKFGYEKIVNCIDKIIKQRLI